MILDYTKFAIKNLRTKKLRSFLTLLGVVIAIATIFVLISASLGLQEVVQEQFRLLGTDKFFIQAGTQFTGIGGGGAVELTKKDVETIKKVSGVKEVTFVAMAPVKIEFEDKIRYTTTIGMDLKTIDLFIETGSYNIDEGRFLKEDDSKSIIIGSQYKYNNYLNKPVKIGDTILINGIEFKVRGILKSIGNSQDDKMVYISIEDFWSYIGIPEVVDSIMVQIEPAQDLEKISENVKRKLLKSRGLNEENRDFSVQTPEQLLDSFKVVLNIITGFLLGVAAISLLVGGIGIANTMFTSVLERTKEIGIMKSVGAKNSDIMIIFLIESGLLGLVGGIIGVLIGFSISKILEYIAINSLGTNLLRAAIPPFLFIGSLLFAFIIGAISGALPAYRASKISSVNALRYE